MYHSVAVTTEGDLYTWGRGQYGVLGNGSNALSLLPLLNDEMKAVTDESGDRISKIDAADEFTGALTEQGELFVWGKNERGQLGLGSGIGIDMVESESFPVSLGFDGRRVRDFHCGQNTMIVQLEDGSIYKTGLKLDYTPKHIDLDDNFDGSSTMLACGRKHYVIANQHDQMLAWGDVFKEKTSTQTAGFKMYFGKDLFNGQRLRQLSMKYGIYGALLE